jgi:hypothetical protein
MALSSSIFAGPAAAQGIAAPRATAPKNPTPASSRKVAKWAKVVKQAGLKPD